MKLNNKLRLAAVGVVQSEKYIHQRRLARAVLAQEGVHGAGLDREVDAVVRHEVTKLFGNPSQLEFHVETLLWSPIDGVLATDKHSEARRACRGETAARPPCDLSLCLESVRHQGWS